MAYIDSYQFDLDQELAAERRAGYGICPKCGGWPEEDGEGRFYTCFFCCDTGSVSMATLEAYERDEADAREQFRPAFLGIFPLAPSPDDWMMDEDDAAFKRAPGHRLFTS